MLALRKKNLACLFLVLFSYTLTYAQAPAARETLRKDSTFQPERYPYILPVLGQRTADRGFKLPYPMGVMANFLYAEQKLELGNFELAFNDSPFINLDSIVRFEDVVADAVTFNARFDTWLLPFLNFYFLAGYNQSRTDVVLSSPVRLEAQSVSKGGYLGLGGMIAGGFGPIFLSADANYSWVFTNLLNQPAGILITGFRFGPIIRFKNKPESNLTFWPGVMWSNFNSRSDGQVRLADVIPNLGSGIDNFVQDLDDWFNDLRPPLQNQFRDRYETIRQGLLDAQENLGTTDLRYRFDKGLNRPFNLLIGMQYQIDYRWQLRAEAQLLGDRTALLISMNYRFGIRGRNFLSGNRD